MFSEFSVSLEQVGAICPPLGNHLLSSFLAKPRASGALLQGLQRQAAPFLEIQRRAREGYSQLMQLLAKAPAIPVNSRDGVVAEVELMKGSESIE